MADLHIIGGTFKNRALKAPKTAQTRPTTAILRKAVFDIARPFIEGAAFLDLFAGSGAMGIEALSRGASHATFVEQNRDAVRCIHDNLNTLRLEEQSTVIQGAVLTVLKKLKTPFDLIYCDPPYDKAAVHLEVVSFLDQSGLVQSGTVVFLEEAYPSKLKIDSAPLARLVHKDSRHFGNSLLHQFICR
jgi:16S rRNA (guanine966-N2)-methyltransferase